jgi:hypothetical protein
VYVVADTNVFSLQYSSLNGFLFADVGVEANGMTLSVLSTLARRGMDPWQEAERLAKLPRMDAVDGLAQIIAATPASRWSLLDARAIASRLVALLPAPGAGPYNASSAQPATKPTMTRGRILVLASAALLFGLTLNLFFSHRAAPPDSAATALWSVTQPGSPK